MRALTYERRTAVWPVFPSVGETDAIRLLLEYGASLHHETKAGVTPLVAAVREGRLEVRACVI
jgi:ankyrin repeat protein